MSNPEYGSIEEQAVLLLTLANRSEKLSIIVRRLDWGISNTHRFKPEFNQVRFASHLMPPNNSILEGNEF